MTQAYAGEASYYPQQKTVVVQPPPKETDWKDDLYFTVKGHVGSVGVVIIFVAIVLITFKKWVWKK